MYVCLMVLAYIYASLQVFRMYYTYILFNTALQLRLSRTDMRVCVCSSRSFYREANLISLAFISSWLDTDAALIVYVYLKPLYILYRMRCVPVCTLHICTLNKLIHFDGGRKAYITLNASVGYVFAHLIIILQPGRLIFVNHIVLVERAANE